MPDVGPVLGLVVPVSVQREETEGSNSLSLDRLAGLVVKASTSGAEDPGFESHL